MKARRFLIIILALASLAIEIIGVACTRSECPANAVHHSKPYRP